ALHGRRPVRRGRGRSRDRAREGQPGRGRPRLRARRQRPDDREPDPGRHPPGHLLRPVRGPGPRPADRQDGQPERRAVQDRGLQGRPRDRDGPRPGLGRREQHAFRRDRRTGDGSHRRRRRQRRVPRDRRADPQAPDYAGGRLCSSRRGRGPERRPRVKPFVLLPAASLAEAARECARPKTELKAGGVDLIDRMKEGLDAPDRVVSIAGVKGLDQIAIGSPTRIGALATLARIADHPELRKTYPALADAAGGAATPQIRNMATLGGNIAQRPRCWYYRSGDFDCRKKGGNDCFAQDGENRFHAIFDTGLICVCVHPSATATALVAYDASVEIVSPHPQGKRTIKLEKLFLKPVNDATRENHLQPGEIIEAVLVPAPAAGARSAYKKLKEKETFDWPLVES